MLPHPIVRALRKLRGSLARARPLGDSAGVDYASKLDGFARFASRELHTAAAALPIAPGQRVLDTGCGTGRLLPVFRDRTGPAGLVVGLDLSRAHAVAARAGGAPVVQADFDRLPFRAGSFAAIWILNALNHAHSPARTLAGLAELLEPGGHLAIAQSAMLPDMMFAWDLRLERAVNDACRRAYHDGYGLEESASAGVRRIAGLLRDGGFADVTATTVVIERLSPLDPDDERYLRDVVFEGYWGAKLRPYLSRADWVALEALCDPRSPGYALRRPDFHHLQTLTVAVGKRPG